MGFEGMDPGTVKDMSTALRKANQAVAGALGTLNQVRTRNDAIAGKRAERLRTSIVPACRRTERCAEVAETLTGQLVNDIGGQHDASRGAAVATTPLPPTTTPVPPPLGPRPPPPAPRPGSPAPGRIQLPGGPRIPSDIVPGDPRPVPPEPELPRWTIPWGLLGKVGGGAAAILTTLFVPDTVSAPRMPYTDTLGRRHMLTEDELTAVVLRRPGHESAVLGYPEGTVLPVEAPGQPGQPAMVPIEPTDPVIAPGGGTLDPVTAPTDHPAAPVSEPDTSPPLAATQSLLPPFVYNEHAGRERPLTAEERALVMRELRAGRLSENTAGWLRAEARNMWREATTGVPGYERLQPRDGYVVHHIRELHWAHLYPDEYPNATTNLALWNSRAHDYWNGQLRTVEPQLIREQEALGITGDQARRNVAEQIMRNWVPTDPDIHLLSNVSRRP